MKARWFLILICFLIIVISLSSSHHCIASPSLTLRLPYEVGKSYPCTQGNGCAGVDKDKCSHNTIYTQYSLDFGTAKDKDAYVLAPITGTAYTHYSESGYGKHINITLIEGEFILLAHLRVIFIANGVTVRRGQVLGIAGQTGWATGPHIHMAYQKGDPTKDANSSISLPIERLIARDMGIKDSEFSVLRGDDFRVGYHYESDNEISLHT